MCGFQKRRSNKPIDLFRDRFVLILFAAMLANPCATGLNSQLPAKPFSSGTARGNTAAGAKNQWPTPDLPTTSEIGRAANKKSWPGELVDPSEFRVRWNNGPWTAAHGLVHIISSLAIWASCTALSVAMLLWLRPKWSSPVAPVFGLIGLLLFANGITHLFDAAMFWWPAYRLEGMAKGATAVLSAVSVVALVRLLPRMFEFRGREGLRAAEQELILSKERFERALDGSCSGLWEWNIDAEEIWFAPRFKEMLGFTDEEFPDTISSLEKALHPDDRRDAINALHCHLREDTVYDVEYRLCTKAGEYRWFQARGVAIRDPSGRPYLMAGSIQDIDARKRAQEVLRERDEQLRQSQKMEALGTLAGGVAHEFNNLLQAIQGYTAYALEGMSESDARRNDLQQVLNATGRAATLTRQLLGFSRREVIEPSDIEPNILVRDIAKMLEPLIGAHINVELRLDDNVGWIHADQGHIQQLVMNLCLNARDAMPLGGRLTIKTENVIVAESEESPCRNIGAGRYLLLEIEDTGCGIASEVKGRIFEPFFTTKEVGRGTGLGLAMVYAAVREHHGAIEVDSELGVGTTFRVYLPIIDQPTAVQAPFTEAVIVGGTETILVADDDPLVRDVAVRTLERAGYQIMTAKDGDEAVRLFKERADDVSLALLDVVMPRLSGRDAYGKIRKIRPTLPALFCSGYDADMAQVELIRDDHLPLITKPYDPNDLLNTVRQVLDNQPCGVI
jgi:PAS domain S-box-containing protein